MKYLLTLIIMLTALAANAQSSEPGIRFFKGNWRKALAEAKKTGKLIFVDVYTDWCIPCKKMEKEIFPLPEVGEKFNTHFINVQLDAEGNGQELASYFKIRSYPTYLWIDGNGDLMYRAGSYNPNPKFFLAHADAALKAANSALTPEERAAFYEKNKHDKAFLRQYVARMGNLERYHETIAGVDQYLGLLTPEELQQPEHRSFLLRHVTGVQSRTFSHILDHQVAFALPTVLTSDISPEVVRRSNEEKLGVMLSNMIIQCMMDSMMSKNDSVFQQLAQYDSRIEHKSVVQPMIFKAFLLQYMRSSGNTDRYVREGVPYLDSLARLSAEELSKLDQIRFDELYDPGKESNRRAGSHQVGRILASNAGVYSKMFADGPQQLEKSIYWAERAAVLSSDMPAVHEQLCNLYLKASRNEDAKKAIRSAMDLVAARDENAESLNAYRIKLENIP